MLMPQSGNLFRRFFVSLAIMLWVGVGVPVIASSDERLNYGDLKESDWDVVVQTGQIKSSKLRELSGLARSTHFKRHFWAVNDSGNKPIVYLINEAGEIKGQAELSTKNVDWEDLVSFQWQGENYLAVADVGDNRARRSEVRLLIFTEPQQKRTEAPITPIVQRFVYEDGARDCEAVGFSAIRGEFILLSKRDAEPHLYALPIKLQSDDLGKAVFLTHVTTIPQPSLKDINKHKFGLLSSQPTALDVAPDESGVMIQTYKNAYWFPFKGDWKNTLQQVPQLLPVPRLAQTEAMAFNSAGDAIFVVSEGRNSPLLKVSALGEQ